MPSLKPMQVARRRLAPVGRDVRPKPSCVQRTDAMPRPMRARLRNAWNATCGSSAHACTQMSPPQRAGSRLVARRTRGGRRAPPGAARRGRSGRRRRATNSAAAEPERDRERRRRQPDRLAGVVGRSAGVVGRSGRPAGPRSSARAAARPLLAATSASVVAVVGGEVERARRADGPAPGVAMPAWCAPWNGDDGVAASAAPSLPADDVRTADARDAAAGDREPRRAAEHRRRRRRAVASVRGRRRHSTISGATFESGSASASTALRERLGVCAWSASCRARSRRPALLYGVERGVDRRELRVDRVGERRVLGRDERPHRLERGLRAVDVGLEVPQVGVRVAILFAGDLAASRPRSAARPRRSRSARARARSSGRATVELLHVGRSSSATGAMPVGVAVRPTALLDPVEARSNPCAGTSFSRASISGSRSPKLSAMGSMRLVVRARGRVELLGLGDVAGLHRGDERGGRRDELARLRPRRTCGSRRPRSRPRRRSAPWSSRPRRR